MCLSDHKFLEAGFMLYLFIPQSLLKGLAHNRMSKMFIKWMILTIDISEIFHRIVLWVGIL